jgi:hypothetical protein
MWLDSFLPKFSHISLVIVEHMLCLADHLLEVLVGDKIVIKELISMVLINNCAGHVRLHFLASIQVGAVVFSCFMEFQVS